MDSPTTALIGRNRASRYSHSGARKSGVDGFIVVSLSPRRTWPDWWGTTGVTCWSVASPGGKEGADRWGTASATARDGGNDAVPFFPASIDSRERRASGAPVAVWGEPLERRCMGSKRRSNCRPCTVHGSCPVVAAASFSLPRICSSPVRDVVTPVSSLRDWLGDDQITSRVHVFCQENAKTFSSKSGEARWGTTF